MKGIGAIALSGGIVALLGVGIAAAVTNPSEVEYQKYAAAQLAEYLETNICTQTPETLGLRDRCRELATSNSPELEQLVAENTERQDYVLFSIYQTDLSVNSLLPPFLSIGSGLPSYHFQTLAVFDKLYTYEVERR